MWETWVRSPGWEDPLEKEMATHSSTLAWRIPWTEEPGELQSMGSQRVGHDWATSLTQTVDYRFVIYSFYYFEACSLYTHFIEIFFYHNWLLNFVKCFFLHLLKGHMIFTLHFINVIYHIDLQMLNILASLKSHLIMVNDLWLHSWILFANILQSFVFVFFRNTGLFLFLFLFW